MNPAEIKSFLRDLAVSSYPTLRQPPTLERIRALLAALGEPQETLRIVHIAGTSGKGSTSSLIAALLQAHGFSVGLSVSPHLVDVRERSQVGGSLPTETEWTAAAETVRTAFETVKDHPLGAPTYYEFLTALAFTLFAQKKVDYAVMETGLGGRFDSTNAVRRTDKLSVLTKIGLDHVHVLGKTVEEIAKEKIGILVPNGEAFSIEQEPGVEDVFAKAAKTQGSRLEFVRLNEAVRDVETRVDGSVFIDTAGGDVPFFLSLPGRHQVENAALALAALRRLAARDGFALDDSDIRKTLETFRLAGRFDRREIDGRTVVLDGAHNPQKMQAFAQTLRDAFPNRRFIFLLNFGPQGDFPEMLEAVIPLAKKIFLMEVILEKEYVYKLQDVTILRRYLEGKGFNDVEILTEIDHAFERIRRTETDDVSAVTGSFHLLSAFYAKLVS